jgi:hypothetical protein
MGKRKRSKQTTLNVKGVLVTAVTVTGLAEMLGKSADTIRRYERQEIFPTSPLKIGNVRYYPLSLVKELKPIVDSFSPNRPPDAEVVSKINLLFNNERDRY